MFLQYKNDLNVKKFVIDRERVLNFVKRKCFECFVLIEHDDRSYNSPLRRISSVSTVHLRKG